MCLTIIWFRHSTSEHPIVQTAVQQLKVFKHWKALIVGPQSGLLNILSLRCIEYIMAYYVNRCNVGGTVGVSGICTVAGMLTSIVYILLQLTWILAGGNVTVEMHQQPGDRSCANEAIGGAHYGPIILYMSKVSNAATDTGSGSWFKVDQEGYDVTRQWWGTVCLSLSLYQHNFRIILSLESIRGECETNTRMQQTLNANCGKRSFIIPSTLAPGAYLLRAEVIALHVAGSVGGAQLYMSCFQLNVTGSGTKNPAGVSFPGAYSATDPGILINIYQTINNYTIPGPTSVFTG